MTPLVSVLIPANNEEAYLGACLDALFSSTALPEGQTAEVIVLPNGCSDATAQIAHTYKVPPAWELRVIEREQGGKIGALNAGDDAARGEILVYLDADVLVEPDLLLKIVRALDGISALYASGNPQVQHPKSVITKYYARFWSTLPFVTHGVPGFGIFAMHRNGRARWKNWPDIISDDTFARLSFAPKERRRVDAGYTWPMIEGFHNLVRVRRRQDRGVAELAERFPRLMANEDKPRMTPLHLLGLAKRTPIGFLVYAAVSVVVRSPFLSDSSSWARGR